MKQVLVCVFLTTFACTATCVASSELSTGIVRHKLQHSMDIRHTKSDSDVARIRRKRWDFTTFSVTEEQKPPQRLATIHSSFDDDTGAVRYSISGKGAGTLFRIDAIKGHLTATHKLDREVESSYSLVVSATYLNGTEAEPPSNITISVQDINDNKPQFAAGHHYAYVKERSPIGSVVTSMIARDADDPKQPYGQIRYRLLPSSGEGLSYFMVNHETGEIKTTTSNLNREEADTYELVVEARDSPGQHLAFSSTATLTVAVSDVNDNPPYFVGKPYEIVIPEDAAVGSEIFRVNTSDADLGENKRSAYSILPGNDGSKFVMETVDNTGVIKVNERLDYERSKGPRYFFTIKAANVHLDPDLDYLGPLDDKAEVVVKVIDVDEPPEFTKADYEFFVSEAAMVGFPIDSVTAIDPEGDSFTYYLEDDSGNFQIGPRSGMISVAGTLDRETQDVYVMKVRAGTPDGKDPRSVATVTIRLEDVNDHPPYPVGDDQPTVVLCQNKHDGPQILKPAIRMMDVDEGKNGAPFRFFQKERSFDLKLVDNGDNTASVHTLRDDYRGRKEKEISFPIIVQDSGKPRLNGTYVVTVRLCYCRNSGGDGECDPMPQVAGIKAEIFIFIAVALLIIALVAASLFLVRRRRSKSHEALIGSKASSAFDDDDVRENIVNYNEEGGGEEDTAAFDLSTLHRDYCSSTSGSQAKDLSSSSPSTRVSFLPPYNPASLRSYPVSSDAIGDFVNERKTQEDGNDAKLPFDSAQIYAYEGAGSDAGSLSSICASSADSDFNYDYLSDWGPRFGRLADMYGAGLPNWPDTDDESGADGIGNGFGTSKTSLPL